LKRMLSHGPGHAFAPKAHSRDSILG
jgi:hypothetical protein